MRNRILYSVLSMLLAYFLLKYWGGSFGRVALYPITMLVTFLHEFGHALGALITGGSVDSLQVNSNGSGLTVTRGGNVGIVLMGGYIGSAVLGNLLFYIGAKKGSWAQVTLQVLAILMVFSGLIWFGSVVSTGILFAFALVLFFLSKKTNWDRDVLMFLGLATILYILEDFRVGPSSDLAMYNERVGIFSEKIWMYIWLVIAVLLTFGNLRLVFKKSNSESV